MGVTVRSLNSVKQPQSNVRELPSAQAASKPVSRTRRVLPNCAASRRNPIRRTELHDLRMRFFGGSRNLPPDVFDQLMLIDPQHRVVLVASRLLQERTILGGEWPQAHRSTPETDDFGLL
jgi:hypothetical protein